MVRHSEVGQPIPAIDDVEAFRASGFWVSPVMFSAEDMAEAGRHADHVVAGMYETGTDPSARYPVNDEKALRTIIGSERSDRTLAKIVTDAGVGQAAAMLLGVDDVVLYHSSLLWKPGFGQATGNVGWHQDRGYWLHLSTENMLTAWVAFDDITADMGPIQFVRGSHQWGLLLGGGDTFFDTDLERQRAGVHVPDGAEWDEFAAEMCAGQVSFHHGLTLHASGPNTSPRTRRSIAIHVMPAGTRLIGNDELRGIRPGEELTGAEFPQTWRAAAGPARAAQR